MSTELDLWQAYLDQELSQAERKEVEEQLAEAPDKQAAFDRFQENYEQGQKLLAPMRASQPFDVEGQLKRLQPHLHAHAGAGAEAKGTPWLWWAGPSFAALAGIAALLLVALPDNGVLPPADGGGLSQPTPRPWRIKGASLRMLHQHKGKPNSHKTRHGTVLRPGDFVQFTYVSRTPHHAMIVSIDAKGKISRYVPLDLPQSIKLTQRSGTLPRQEAIELDGSLGSELFLMLIAKESFAYEDVKQALARAYEENKRSLEGLLLPDALPGQPGQRWISQQSMLIRKQPTTTPPTR